MDNKIKLEELVLATLSFYEPMTFSQIIIDFDNEILSEFPDFDKVQLQEIINDLEKKKRIKKIIIDKEAGWIRIFPQKSFIRKLLGLFNA